MKIRRRQFLNTAAIAGVGLASGARLSAQDAPARGNAPKPPTYAPKIEMLWKSPDRYPNALEASPEGLWLGDQVSERINLLDWKTGKVLEDFIGEAHNTSGLAVGGGHIWVGCNGAGTAASLREFKRPHDNNFGEIVKLDMKGKQVKAYRNVWGSGVHGTYYNRQSDKLWAVAPGPGFLMEMDPKDELRITRMVQIRMNVPHGLDFHEGSFYVIDGADRLVHRLDDNGRVLESWVFGPNDPDPHGMCVYDNHVYFTDAGLGGGRKPSAGTKPQMIFRFPLTRG